MHLFPYLHEYIRINNFIHNILIKTINNDTFKQSVETTVPVHAFNVKWQHINQFSTII